MNRLTKTLPLTLLGIICLARLSAFAADTIVPDLRKVSQGVGVKIADPAKAKWEADAKGKPALFANTVVWLDGINFTEGTIECDILGKSAPRGSNFLGIAFHGVDDTTFDCVYFRPFN